MATQLYIGSNHGVRTMGRTASGGWEEIAAPRFPDFAVTDVLALPGRPEVVLAATRGDGMWLSSDAGQSFVKPNRNTLGPGKLHCLAVDPLNPNRVYAGGEPVQLWVTDDLGQTWDDFPALREHPAVPPMSFPVPGTEQYIDDMQIDTTDPSIWYLALQVGAVMKTTDAGKTWTHCDGVDPDTHNIQIDPGNHRRVLAATGGESSGDGRKALYLTEDAAETWTPLGLEFDLDYAIEIKPFKARPGVWVSALGEGPPPRWRRAEGARGVMIRSEDAGRTWTPADTSAIEGFSTAFPYTLAPSAEDPDTMFGGLNDGRVIETNDGGLSWHPLGIQVEGTAHGYDIEAVSI